MHGQIAEVARERAKEKSIDCPDALRICDQHRSRAKKNKLGYATRIAVRWIPRGSPGHRF